MAMQMLTPKNDNAILNFLYKILSKVCSIVGKMNRKAQREKDWSN